MARQLLNLCLDVPSGGLTVSVVGFSEGETPAVPSPYYFEVFYSQADTPTPEQGSSIELSEGTCRLIAWDDVPPAPTNSLFEQRSMVALGVKVTFSPAPSIVSAGTRDPWPPT